MTVAALKVGILFATPGTTCRDAQNVFERIRKAAAIRFPGIPSRWALSSSGVRRKLAIQGVPCQSPHEALLAMQAEGFTHVAVVSLHFADGMEYGELEKTVAGFQAGTGALKHVVLSHPLLALPDEWREVLQSLLVSLQPRRDPADAVVLVAHGSLEPRAVSTFSAASAVCRQVDPRLFLGMILGTPSREDVVRHCSGAGIRKAWLLPCFVAAGFTAREEIAGDGTPSWKTAFQAAGIECESVLRGLGEYDEIVKVWLDQAGNLLKTLRCGVNG